MTANFVDSGKIVPYRDLHLSKPCTKTNEELQTSRKVETALLR